MRSRLALATCLALPLALSAAPAPSEDRVTAWRDDLRVLGDELQRIHPRFQTCGLPPALEQTRAALSRRLGELEDPQVVVELQRLLAAVGDGHTLLYPFGMKRGVLLRVPVQLWSFAEGVYVVDAPEAALVGRRVVKIGALDADEALRRLAPYVSHDNDQQLAWAAPFYATCTDFLVAIGAASDRTRVTLAFSDGSARTLDAAPIDPERIELKLIAPRTAAAPLWLAHRDRTFTTAELPGGVLYVQVNALSDSGGETLAEFGRSLRARIADRAGLVLDLRLDNGGEATKADELLKTLIAFDTRGGRLAILVGRMTFSAAQTLATRLDQWTNAMFLGEPTGSRPNHYGNERTFTLPHSGLRGSIASGFNQPITANDDRATITPEVLVPLRAAEYFAGDDPALAAALAALGAK